MTIVAALLLATASPQATPAPISPPTPAAGSPVDPARLTIGRELIAIVLPPSQRDQMMAGTLNAMMNNMVAGLVRGSGLEADLRDNPAKRVVFERFVERQRTLTLDDIKLAMPGLIEAYAHAYARMFTVEELTAIKAFAQTPAGTKFLQRGAALMSDPDVGAWQQVLAAKGAVRQQAEVAKLLADMAAAGKEHAS